MKKDLQGKTTHLPRVNDKPYVKQFDAEGNITNPITKEKPYLTSTSSRGGKKFRRTNNSRGFGILIRQIGVLTFEKSKIVKQQLFGKTVPHLIASNERK